MGEDELIYQYKDQLYRLCVYLEKNTFRAEELFQDTWVKALEKLESYDQGQPFYPWISKIAVNLYRDRLRRLKREMRLILWSDEDEVYDCVDQEANVQEQVEENEVRRELGRCIGMLPDKYKLPLILAYQENLSYREIATVLDSKEATIKSRIYDGKQRLRKLLEKEGVYEAGGVRTET
ncbi:MAG: RNA polymerase sigma factor [Cellulosilyticaceae bacterium]